MLALTILSIFILIIILIIFIEYRNEKKYQAQRRKTTTQKKHEHKKMVVRKAPQKSKPKPKMVVKPDVKVKAPEPRLKPKVEIKPEPKIEAPKQVKTKELPEAKYPEFTHVRLIEMGLSDDEAQEFVAELIPQIETEIPLIETATQEGDFHKIERLTHGIKGSATNLGTGGVSDLLVEYNTYLKSGRDIAIAEAYFEHLKRYTDELKTQYN